MFLLTLEIQNYVLTTCPVLESDYKNLSGAVDSLSGLVDKCASSHSKITEKVQGLGDRFGQLEHSVDSKIRESGEG